MNSLTIILISIVALSAGYLFYGRWLAKRWGIDEKAKTPACEYEDGEDFVPSSKFTVFSHQFSSIAGAGPGHGTDSGIRIRMGAGIALADYRRPVFRRRAGFWRLYASVKNEGKSMGMIIEKYIGKGGRKLFMLFCWLFTLLVIAAFTDMVAGTFVGTGLEEASVAYANSAAASISMLFIVVAIIFGLIQKKVGKMNEAVKALVAIALLVRYVCCGYEIPNLCFKKCVDLYYYGLSVPGICYADVAFDAAKRLYDDFYASWNDWGRSGRCTVCPSGYGTECFQWV